MASPFVAEIRIWACNFAPTGWAQCDGQLLPLSQNTALFSLLGTTYGGDGKSTFALPDLQGMAADAFGSGSGVERPFSGRERGRDKRNVAEHGNASARAHQRKVSKLGRWFNNSRRQYLGCIAGWSRILEPLCYAGDRCCESECTGDHRRRPTTQ